MSVDGGYWVLGLQMEAIERADRAELPAGDWAIALASDGFLRLADMFAHLGASDLLSLENRAEFETRSEERRVGKECVSTCRSRWSPYHSQKNQKNNDRKTHLTER